MPNRLAGASSPYLRSHADNPVDWWSWGPEPFAEAERRNVPVMVSIGYSTCHWCHVMARESFSDPELAPCSTSGFVAIKVDREEHAEVDAAYLAAASAFTAEPRLAADRLHDAGGPRRSSPARTVAADADARPRRRSAGARSGAGRLGGPPRTGGGDRRGARRWRSPTVNPGPPRHDRSGCALSADLPSRGGSGVRRLRPPRPTRPSSRSARCWAFLSDRGPGSRGAAPAPTLDATAHLADPDGGFYRYATMRDWSEPHYERMLDDNAQLLGAYALAGRRRSPRASRSSCSDVLREPGGAFRSAQDSEPAASRARWYLLPAEARRAGSVPLGDRRQGAHRMERPRDRVARPRRPLLGHPEWVDAAATAASASTELNGDGRSSLDGVARARRRRSRTRRPRDRTPRSWPSPPARCGGPSQPATRGRSCGPASPATPCSAAQGIERDRALRRRAALRPERDRPGIAGPSTCSPPDDVHARAAGAHVESRSRCVAVTRSASAAPLEVGACAGPAVAQLWWSPMSPTRSLRCRPPPRRRLRHRPSPPHSRRVRRGRVRTVRRQSLPSAAGRPATRARTSSASCRKSKRRPRRRRRPPTTR